MYSMYVYTVPYVNEKLVKAGMGTKIIFDQAHTYTHTHTHTHVSQARSSYYCRGRD